MKKNRIIILTLIIGFAIAMILMSVLIYFGYCEAYRTDANQYTVSIWGISIYKLIKVETGYSAAAIGPNMGIVCGICMAVSFIAGRIIHKLRSR